MYDGPDADLLDDSGLGLVNRVHEICCPVGQSHSRIDLLHHPLFDGLSLRNVQLNEGRHD